jgi:hypothetical protein
MLYKARIYSNTNEHLVLDECSFLGERVAEIEGTIVEKLSEGEGGFMVDFESDPYKSNGKHEQFYSEYVRLKVSEREGFVFKPSKYHTFTVYDAETAPERLTFKQALAVILPPSCKHIQKCVYSTTLGKWRALYKKYINTHENGLESTPPTLPRETALSYALRLFAYTKKTIVEKSAKWHSANGIQPIACDIELDDALLENDDSASSEEDV